MVSTDQDAYLPAWVTGRAGRINADILGYRGRWWWSWRHHGSPPRLLYPARRPQALERDDIVDEAAVAWRRGKGGEQRGAIIVVADHRVDRKGAVGHRRGQPCIGFRIAGLGQVAGHQQQVGAVGPVAQSRDHRAQALHVELVGIVPIEADVDVGDLGDQHARLATFAGREPMSCPA